MRIQLTRGKEALIDAADAGLVSGNKWQAAPEGLTWYARRTVTIDGRKIAQQMHHLILGAKAGECVDHISGDGIDNRRANLRIATVTVNNRNRRARPKGASRFKGERSALCGSGS